LDLKFHSGVELLYSNQIEFITIQATEAYRNGKVHYKWNDEFFSVETFIEYLLIENGFKCFPGLLIKNVFKYISYDIENIDDLILKLENEKQFGKTIHGKRIHDLKKLKKDFTLARLKFDNENDDHIQLLNSAKMIHNEIRGNAGDTYERESSLFDFFMERPENEVRPLKPFFEKISALQRGTPDFYIFNDNEYYFVEVKSDKDSLSKYQICFINYFRQMVGDNIKVLQVVNDKW
jgi:hypothetical protein